MPQTMEEHLDELEDQANENEDISFSSIDEDNVHEVNWRATEIALKLLYVLSFSTLWFCMLFFFICLRFSAPKSTI